MADSLLTVEAALALIQEHTRPLAPTEVPLADALGLRLVADAISDIDSPPHDKAMMDGYAVTADEPSSRLSVIEEVVAGAVPTLPVTPGVATRIMTGAPLPEGAGAVIPVEATESDDDHSVRLLNAAPTAGKHVMRRGEVFARGDVVVPAGSLISPAKLAVMAETGHAHIQAIPRPRVAILATGDELVEADQTPAAGQIRNSNGPMLTALVRVAGATPRPLDVARDNRDSLLDRIDSAADCDVLLISGGVSAGKRDLAPGVLSELGVEQVLHKVAVKPGKPLWFGVWRHPSGRQTLVFGLPGNPCSGFVCFQVFVLPALKRLAGGPFCGLPRVKLVLAEPVQIRGDRFCYLPAIIEQDANVGWSGRPAPWRGSADLKGIAAANALLELAPAEAPYPVDQQVSALLIHADS